LRSRRLASGAFRRRPAPPCGKSCESARRRRPPPASPRRRQYRGASMIGSRLRSLVPALAIACAVAAPRASAQDNGYSLMLQDAQRKLRKGQLSAAESQFLEIVDAWEEEPEASRPQAAQVERARLGLFDIDLRQGRYEQV